MLASLTLAHPIFRRGRSTARSRCLIGRVGVLKKRLAGFAGRGRMTAHSETAPIRSTTVTLLFQRRTDIEEASLRKKLIAFLAGVQHHFGVRIEIVFLTIEFAGEEVTDSIVNVEFLLPSVLVDAVAVALHTTDRRKRVGATDENRGRGQHFVYVIVRRDIADGGPAHQDLSEPPVLAQ